jgi:hypothetical protein
MRSVSTHPGVMRGHSRPKDGVASLAYDPRIHEAVRQQKPYGSHTLHFIMDCRVKPGNDQRRGLRIKERRQALMVSGSFRQNGLRSFLGFVSPNCSPLFSPVVVEGCSTRAAALPLLISHRAKLHRSGGACARPPLGMSPHPRGAKRRQALVRIAAPVGPPCGKARPSSGREQPAHDADRRAYRRLTGVNAAGYAFRLR